jgi:tetratricopeptide (TPR) repeat protein
MREYEQALADYRKYINLEPMDTDAYLLRAKANLLMGNTAEASSDVEVFYSLAESMEPWRIELLEPYETLRTDWERLMWMNEAVSPGALLPGL